MAIEDYGVLAAAVGVAVIVGFVLGKLTTNISNNRSSSQRITQNEIARWKINSKYADILTQKNPAKLAEQELKEIDKLKEQNMKEIEEIESKLSKFLDKLENIRKEGEELKERAPIQLSAQREVAVSLWTSMYTELRQDVEDCNATNVRHGYSKRLLKFIIHGNIKPGLIELMDNTSLDDEIQTATLKKNFKLVEAVFEAMNSDSAESIDQQMGWN